jgi:hypothetical protein
MYQAQSTVRLFFWLKLELIDSLLISFTIVSAPSLNDNQRLTKLTIIRLLVFCHVVAKLNCKGIIAYFLP